MGLLLEKPAVSSSNESEFLEQFAQPLPRGRPPPGRLLLSHRPFQVL